MSCSWVVEGMQYEGQWSHDKRSGRGKCVTTLDGLVAAYDGV